MASKFCWNFEVIYFISANQSFLNKAYALFCFVLSFNQLHGSNFIDQGNAVFANQRIHADSLIFENSTRN